MMNKSFIIFLMCFLTFVKVGFAERALQKENVIFSRYTGTNWQIWVKDLNNGEEKQLTYSPIDKRAPQCISGGKRIVYRTANSELVLFDIETQQEEKLLKKFGTIMDQHLSKDGKRIVFARLRSDLMDDSDIWVSSIAGDNVRSLTNDSGLQYNPVFLADKNRIAFVSRADDAAKAHNIWVIDGNGENKKQLTESTAYDVMPDFSPDGKHMVFSSNRAGNYDIWLLNLGTNEIKQLTTFNGLDISAVFSSDGQDIAFVSTRGESKQVWVMDKDGKGLTQITSTEDSCQDPSWCKGANNDSQ